MSLESRVSAGVDGFLARLGGIEKNLPTIFLALARGLPFCRQTSSFEVLIEVQTSKFEVLFRVRE